MVPLTVNFTSNYTSSDIHYNWDFNGDGLIDACIANPVYTYTSGGDMSVTLSVDDGFYTEVSTILNYIHIQTPSLPSISDYSPHIDSLALSVNTLIEFSVEAYYDGPLSYIWTINGETQSSTTTSLIHIFDTEGIFSVMCSVTGGQTTVSQTWIIDYQSASNDDNPESTDRFSLRTYPNPCRGDMSIDLSLASSSPAELCVFNLRGEKVRQFAVSGGAIGHRALSWNGCDDRGRPLANGMYLLRCRQGREVIQSKVILMR
jgi:hypothetical protein